MESLEQRIRLVKDFARDRAAYTRKKSEFIGRVMEKARRLYGKS